MIISPFFAVMDTKRSILYNSRHFLGSALSSLILDLEAVLRIPFAFIF